MNITGANETVSSTIDALWNALQTGFTVSFGGAGDLIATGELLVDGEVYVGQSDVVSDDSCISYIIIYN